MWRSGLAYLCWLSWVVFLVTSVSGSGDRQRAILYTEAERLFKLAREEQDQLFKHFRAHRRN